MRTPFRLSLKGIVILRRLVIRTLIGLGAVCVTVVGVLMYGYYAHKLRVDPVYSLTERVESKIRRTLPFKTDLEQSVERIETIFLTLRGRVHVMPGRDWQNGGGLTDWGDDLLVMHKSGKVFWLARDEEDGLVRADIAMPENGRDGYARVAAERFPGRPTQIERLRYNDIEFIDADGRRGLLVSYTYVDAPNACYRTRVSWLPVSKDVATIRDIHTDPEDWTLLYQTSPCLPFNESGVLMLAYMAGGRIAFKAPNLVYLGSGEYHADGIYRADAGIQSDDSDYGKTIEIDLDTGAARHYSKGHRNLQGVALDAQGRLWTTEHGMRGGDELNLIEDGENYGWPIEDMGTLYNGVPNPSPSGPGRHTIYRAPVYAWVPSAAVSSLALVDGFDETWDGDLLIGSLKGKTLFRARIHGDRLVSLEPIPIGERIRDVQQWGPDRIALWMDFNEVVILEIEPRFDPLSGLANRLEADGMDAVLAETARQTLSGCNECHSYERDIHGAGPSLAGVVGRPVAGTGFSGYSAALSALPGTWTPDRLAHYLTDPEAVAPGTAMIGLGIGDRAVADAVVKALSAIDATVAGSEDPY
jgi:cytochrome c2